MLETTLQTLERTFEENEIVDSRIKESKDRIKMLQNCYYACLKSIKRQS